MNSELLRRASDRSAPNYDERFGELQRDKFQRALAKVRIPPGPLLDAGCGTGLLAAHAERADWTGVDVSMAMLRRAAERGVRCVQADLDRLPFRAASFAGVLAFTSMVDRPSATPALPEMARVVRPGGLVLVTLLPHDLPGDWDDVAAAAGLGPAERFECGQDLGLLHWRRPRR